MSSSFDEHTYIARTAARRRRRRAVTRMRRERALSEALERWFIARGLRVAGGGALR
jgi:hypothetical protein